MVKFKENRNGLMESMSWFTCNYIKSHMSLDLDDLEIPAKAYVRKMPKKGTKVIGEQTGEKYNVE